MSGELPSLDDKLDGLRSRVLRVIRERTGLHEEFALPIAAEIVATFWREVSGERVYVPARDPDLAAKVIAEFNGQNREELCRKYEIGRATFYRYIHQRRGKSPVSQSTRVRDEFTF